MLKQLLIASVFASACAPAFAASIDPNNAIALTPDQIQWKKGEASDTSWPIGDPAKPGACLELIKWHPGHFSHPHYHSHARYAVVVDGTWWVSTNNVYDPDHNTVPYPKVSVLTDLVIGHDVETGMIAHREFLELMQSKGAGAPDEEVLEDAVAFAGVSRYPARVKCALLSWMAWKDATAQATGSSAGADTAALSIGSSVATGSSSSTEGSTT